MADPRTGLQQALLRANDGSLSDASWSAANELLLFTQVKNEKKRLFAVRLPRATGKIEGNWINIPVEGTPDRPRWSADGKAIFFVSTQDGFRCIYGQAFSGSAPQGAPYAIAHFHHGHRAIDTVLPRSFNMSVGEKSLFFNLGDQSSAIELGHLSSSR